MPVKITQSYLKNVAVPTVGSVTVYDSELTGFGARIHAKGTRQLFLDYRLDGASKRIAIGKWGDWSADEARAKAKQLRQIVDSGGDPAGEKRQRREAATIGDLIERFKQDRATKNRRPKEDDRMLAEIADILGRDTKVSAVHYGDMEDLHKKVTHGYAGKKPRPVRANRVLALASVLFSLSLRPLAGEDKPWRSAIDGNPCRGIPKNPEQPAGRLYSSAEMVAIADALSLYPGVASDCIKMVAATGCRPCEARKALWSEFDEVGFWTKPSSHTKQKREHRVPLSPPAMALIEQFRSKRAPGVAEVFPGRSAGTCIETLCHAWRFVRARCGFDVSHRVYDLRHSFASYGAGAGLGLPIIGKLLGHSSAKTTERYARHLSDDPLKRAVDLIADRITGAPDDAGDNVVVIPAGRRA
jgi:integrase